MKYETMNVKVEDHIALVTIDSKPVNSITPQMMDDFESVFKALEEDMEVRAVVVASGLEKIFVAGADINQFTGWKKQDGIDVTTRGHEVFNLIANLRVPVICAVNGIAFGGGLELALACDIRVMDKKAKVGLPETGLGIVPGYGGTQRLPRLVGTGMAKKMILTADPISGEEAYRIGLGEVLAEPGESLTVAMEMAKKICSRAPFAVEGGKKCVNYTVDHSLEEGSAYEIQCVGMLADTEDKTEGADAFLGKRPPNFSRK